MKLIYKSFKQAVVDLTFRLLPSEGSMPWAIEFPAQDTDDSHSTLTKPYAPKFKYSPIEPVHDHSAQKLLDEFEADVDELEEDFEDLEDDSSDDLEDDMEDLEDDDDEMSDEDWDDVFGD